MAGAAAIAPRLGASATAQTSPVDDADALFRAGKFEQAGLAYEKILEEDPTNLHAARRRGHVALLSNKFPDAEKYFTMALGLAPDDKETNERLGDCYLRQDKFSLAAARWQAAGDEFYPAWFGNFPGQPYQIHGDVARLPWQRMDPSPQFEASVNGGPARRFSFYTGISSAGVSLAVAKEAGLTPLAKQRYDQEDEPIWLYGGVLESLQLGGIELRNIPVMWSEPVAGEAVREDNDGMIGTSIFHHLLATIDYAGRSLILRRRTPDTVRKARAEAERAGAEPLPLWQNQESALFTIGSVDGSGPRVVSLPIGGISENAAILSGETAERLGVRTDYDRPIETFGHGHPATVYPCYPKEIRIGDAVARDIYCHTRPDAGSDTEGFDAPAAFFHSFYKPFTVTLDFTNMNFYIARGKAS